MRRKTTILTLTATVASLAAATASALDFKVLDTSTLNDVRLIGAANILNIGEYSSCIAPSTCAGTLDPLDPANWTPMDRDITTYPDVTVESNDINVSGTLSLTDVDGVTAAELNQLGPMSWGTFQSDTVNANLVAGDTSLLNIDPISGATVTSVYSNPMVWTYNSVDNTLKHQAGGGAAATSSSIATCVVVVGTVPGSCRMFAGAIDASGELGGVNINNSIFSWDGLAANYIVRDGQTTPWHDATGTASTGGLYVSGDGGHAGVTWTLNDCTEASLTGCTITARVVGSALASGNGNATATSGLYTLNLLPVGQSRPEDDSVDRAGATEKTFLIDVTANDLIDDRENFVLTIVEPPTKGTVLVIGDQIEYTGDRRASGGDTFSYQIDGNGFESESATVTISNLKRSGGGGSSAMDLWVLSLLGAGFWLRRRRG